MSRLRPLRGSCACGRIEYLVSVPTEAREDAQVFFDDNSENRRTQAAPLTAWLRVPLSWFQSAVVPYYPDETHSSIRRTFTPRHAPHCKRVFCGFCGTQLTYWSEQPQHEADFLNITIGSLVEDDLQELEELGLVPEDATPDSLISQAKSQDFSRELSATHRQGSLTGLPWFEDLIAGSRLERTGRTRRGMGVSADGSTTVEWEITEWTDDNSDKDPASGTAKRKIDDVVEGTEKDVQMRS